MRFHSVWRGLMAAAVLFFATGCDSDNPTQTQQFGEISGTVTFIGSWPSVGEIQVSAWTSWPPTGPPAAASDPLQKGVNVQNYKLEGLQKGTYQVITVGWRDPSNPAGAKVIGVYWEQADSLGVDANGNMTVAAKAIVIDENSMVHSNINIKANLDIVQ